jgi:hypothetical protein
MGRVIMIVEIGANKKGLFIFYPILDLDSFKQNRELYRLYD